MAMPLPPNLAARVAKGELTQDAANSRMLANRPDWIAAHGGSGSSAGPNAGGVGGQPPTLNMPPPSPTPTMIPPPGSGIVGSSPGTQDIQSAIQNIRAQLGPQAQGGPQAGNAGMSFQGSPLGGPMPPSRILPPVGPAESFSGPNMAGGGLNPQGVGAGVPTGPGAGVTGMDSGSGPGGAGGGSPTMNKPLPITSPGPVAGRMTPPIFAGGQQGPIARGLPPAPPQLGRMQPPQMGKPQKPQNRIGKMYQGLVQQRVPYAY